MGKRRARFTTERRRGRKRRRGKEEGGAEAESEGDFCFACKDGGLLRVCDYRNCHKPYHPECVGKDDDFLNSDGEFICDWHTCFICKGRSYYRCFCCPSNSVCRGCVKQAEFVQVTSQTKGFCNNCLRMALMIEKDVDVDSDGERVDFSDRETYEFLFKDYWAIIKEKEGLTLGNLQQGYTFLKNGLNCDRPSDSEKLPDEEYSSDDDFLGNSDDDKPIRPLHLNGTSNKIQAFLKKRRSKKNVYVGWGSKQLIGFLSSIGKDVSKTLDQFGAAEVVKEYIRQKGLLQKDKKKLVICDDRLRSLFSKSKLKVNKIYSLLERHIAENTTSDDETPASSSDNDDSTVKKKTQAMNSESRTPKWVSERYKKCFASLVHDNIKLIYLRRSLVMDMLKQPETFESKVTGCFVRVKNDPRDYSLHKPKTLYQLGQVTGIGKSSEEYKIRDTSTDMLLCVSNIRSEVKISLLSDEDFEEEECEFLRVLAQNGPVKRHTVAELEEKARSVHGDIVNHGINRELQRLEKLIEKANEKGWHQEMHEHIDRRELLRRPSERQRLLDEVPEVIPDVEDIKDSDFVVPAAEKACQNKTAAFQGSNVERTVYWRRCSKEKSKGANGEIPFCLKSCSEEKSKATKVHGNGDPPGMSVEKQGTAATKAKDAGDTPNTHVQKQATEANKEEAGDSPAIQVQNQATEANKEAAGDAPATHVQNQATEVNKEARDAAATHVQNQVIEAAKADAAGHTAGIHFQKQGSKANAGFTSTEVIDIDDDEDDSAHDEDRDQIVDLDVDNESGSSGISPVAQQEAKHRLCRGQKAMKAKGVLSEHKSMWCYTDPQGDEQGPFTMELLRHWNKVGWFKEGFKVWRAGQSSASAILLRDALLLTM